jgi:Skp family chaperone for outer membrane proteins
LLEEMGKRLKGVEQSLDEEKKRQEATLMKNLKKRQERNKKVRLEELDKKQQKLETQVSKMNAGVDAEKAKIYAEDGGDALIDNEVTAKKNKIS